MRLLSPLIALIIILMPQLSWATQNTKAKQAIVMDYKTGQILFSQNADERMPTSSMSKVMTMYMVFDALKNGRISMDTTFNVSEKAWRMGGSKMFVDINKQIAVKDLVQGVVVQSGNDATIVLAEGLTGSEEDFARAMTAKAAEIGMKDSNFVNASGWPDPDHYSTVHDLALLSKKMIENFPEYYKFFAEKEYVYNSIKQQNRNPLLYRNIGADGLKTGHTEAAGYGLMGTAVKDGRRVLMVVNGLENEKERADESVRLIEWALNNFINMQLAKAGQKIADANVAMGKVETVPLILQKDIELTIPRFAQKSFTVDVKYNGPLIAPIQQGQEVATMTVNIPDHDPLTYPLVAGINIEKIGFLKGTLKKMEFFFFGK